MKARNKYENSADLMRFSSSFIYDLTQISTSTKEYLFDGASKLMQLLFEMRKFIS